MRGYLFVILFLLAAPVSFAGSQKSDARLYGSYLKGLLYLQRGDYEQGLRQLEKAKAKDPRSVHARLKIATVLIRLGKTEEAITVLREAKKLDPDNLEISLALIFIYSYDQRDEALEVEYETLLTKAHQLKPADVAITEYLAQYYFYKGKLPEAIALYQTIISQEPEYVDGYFWLGYLYSESGDSPQAVAFWEKGLGINADYAPILNSLGYTWAEEGVRLDDAETMIKKALVQEPENGAYLDSLGWVYFKKGKLEDANKYLEQALQYTQDPEIYAHIGDVAAALGNVEKAVEYYRQGSEQFPEHEALQSRLKVYEGNGQGTQNQSDAH